MNMGKPKKYLRKSINFGGVGNPARILIEKFISKYENSELSSLIRKLVTIYLSDNPEYKDWKIQMLRYEKRKLAEELQKLSKKMQYNSEKLKELGVDPDDFIY